MIRDRLVVGIRDAALSQQLQLDPELTLETVKKKILQREAVGEQNKELKEESKGSKLEAVHACRSFKGKRQHSHSRDSKAKATPKAVQTCTRCRKGSHP